MEKKQKAESHRTILKCKILTTPALYTFKTIIYVFM